MRGLSEASRLATSIAAVGLVTLCYAEWLEVSNPAIVSTTYLLVVLLVAATSRFLVAAITSVAAILCFNFFFLPPIGRWTIAESENWVALIALLAVSLVASNLSAAARARADEAVGRRNELARLFDLSRDVLTMAAGREALSWLADAIGRRFDLEFVAIALTGVDGAWDIFDAGRPTTLEPAWLTNAMLTKPAGHHTVTRDDHDLRLVPLRVASESIGLLAVQGRPVEAGTLDALAGLVALAIERAGFLEDLRAAEITKHREALKTALLASLGHDLRTPLAAIRVAAANIRTADSVGSAQSDQADVIVTEAERLGHLFDNILEMARIDAGAVELDARWTHPTEIIDAARSQAGRSLARHEVRVRVDDDSSVKLDPRLAAGAVAQLLENAARYSPAGTSIDVSARVTRTELTFQVRDYGPGIAEEDLAQLFDRFYRGHHARHRASGTGMGLSIAKGLLAVTGGRVSAANASGGGAEFTIVVPVSATRPDPLSMIPT